MIWRELIGFNPVVPFNFSKATPITAADPQLLYGVELEIENTHGNEWTPSGMLGKEDGSLRNNGWEYITLPMTISNLKYCLQKFFDKSGVTMERNYSERCSVHVHANCQDMTVSQIQSVAMLYQTFEQALFAFCGGDRDKSIFCVPWSETNLSYGIISSFEEGDKSFVKLRQWQKYTALNLLPLFEFGTVEFRHMAGTNDLTKIIDWCNIIGCMFAFAKANSPDEIKKAIMSLNTNSQYKIFTTRVFRQWTDLISNEDLNMLIEDGVLAMKYGLMKSNKKENSTNNLNWRDALHEALQFDRAAARPRQTPEAVINALNTRGATAWQQEVIRPNDPGMEGLREQLRMQREQLQQRAQPLNNPQNPFARFTLDNLEERPN